MPKTKQIHYGDKMRIIDSQISLAGKRRKRKSLNSSASDGRERLAADIQASGTGDEAAVSSKPAARMGAKSKLRTTKCVENAHAVSHSIGADRAISRSR